MSDAWAAIVAAVIGAVGVIIATNLAEIKLLLRRGVRNIAGDWNAVSCRTESNEWVGDYVVHIKQTGAKVRAEMTSTKVPVGWTCFRYKWSGEIIGDYLLYTCIAVDTSTHLVSSGLLYLHPGGKELVGSFVANESGRAATRTWVGSTTLKRVTDTA